jgi:hypothetical protein
VRRFAMSVFCESWHSSAAAVTRSRRGAFRRRFQHALFECYSLCSKPQSNPNKGRDCRRQASIVPVEPWSR